ncbi:PD-(D/E)XK nuclease family protein [Streptomyces nondiastaticus]|uniref:PD-(D/E)XK nuclease family protein n=1 Tax=Streptomyces nondiastaticus TaxID=3154512 RepID=A0ABW6TT26_9ACTN
MADYTAWQMQQWMTGDESLVRVGPGTGAGAEEVPGCPARDAAEARPGVRVRVPSRLPHEHLETFTLGPVCDVLDLIEFEGEPLERALDALLERPRPLHPGHLAYAEHAVRLYAGRPDPHGLTPVKPYWVVRKDNGRRWELYAWWRRYQSADGSVREYRRLRHAGARASTPGEIAIAAYTAAFGFSASWPRRWPREFALHDSPSRVTHVRIVETGLADGSRNVQFEGTVDEARAYYDAFGDAHVRSVVKGGPERPGPACADCKQFTGCGAVRRSPGALALPSRKLPLRKVSAGELQYHALCPAQAFLRALRLPQSDECSDAAKLDQAVHGWIEALHRRDGRPACVAADMPAPGANWTRGRWRVPDEEAELGRRMLLHHVNACPFRNAALIERAEPGPLRVVHDTAAQALVVAKPDLLYREDGSWVWRDLKTTRAASRRAGDLLDAYPRIALAVVLLAQGALGGDAGGSRVEVEILRPGGSDTQVIDPTDPERLAKARAVLRRYAGPWRADHTWEARPGRHCRWCPVSRWCTSAVRGEDAEEKA